MIVERIASPNWNDRKTGIDMLMLHYTGMETGEAALDRLRDPDAAVSAHYMVWDDGRITQLVDEDKRAWHAGVGTWQGDHDLNSHSIGIEIVNGGHNVPLADGTLPPYPDVQTTALMTLAVDIVERHAIPQSRIVGHSDVAPGRKIDPGEHFPWAMLADKGLGIWPDRPTGGEMMGAGLGVRDSGASVERLQAALQRIGYGVEITAFFDAQTSLAVEAFQRRWQPERVTGEAGWLTIALIDAVATQAGNKKAPD
ncbi:MAG: N-acetylmuramoyl-L-alanine amidase [Pseudomonadota bacterium]